MTWREEAEEQGRAAAQSLCNQVNAFDSEDHVAKGFLDGLCGEHRTLQQSFWKMMFRVADEYSQRDNPAWVDARNEAAMNVCGKVAKVVNDPANTLPNI